MLGSPKVRVVRKAAQKARLKAKKNGKGTEYAEFYANQPQQQMQAEGNEKIRQARIKHKEAIETLQIAEITGEELVAAQESEHIARLVVQKLVAATVPRPQIQLTNAAGA